MKSVLTIPAIVLFAATAQAQPFAHQNTAPPVGQIYTFTTTLTGANSNEAFKIPSPPNGFYMISFKANFQAHGSVSNNLTDSCWLELNGTTFAQSTGIDTGDFTVGVSAEAPIQITSKSILKAFCGSSTAWLFGSIPLQVTLVRTAGETAGTLKDLGSEFSHRNER